MVSVKQSTIKTTDFEAKTERLIKDIETMEHTTKTAVLALIRAYKSDLVKYGPREEIAIPSFLEVRNV